MILLSKICLKLLTKENKFPLTLSKFNTPQISNFQSRLQFENHRCHDRAILFSLVWQDVWSRGYARDLCDIVYIERLPISKLTINIRRPQVPFSKRSAILNVPAVAVITPFHFIRVTINKGFDARKCRIGNNKEVVPRVR